MLFCCFARFYALPLTAPKSMHFHNSLTDRFNPKSFCFGRDLNSCLALTPPPVFLFMCDKYLLFTDLEFVVRSFRSPFAYGRLPPFLVHSNSDCFSAALRPSILHRTMCVGTVSARIQFLMRIGWFGTKGISTSDKPVFRFVESFLLSIFCVSLDFLSRFRFARAGLRARVFSLFRSAVLAVCLDSLFVVFCIAMENVGSYETESPECTPAHKDRGLTVRKFGLQFFFKRFLQTSSESDSEKTLQYAFVAISCEL